MRRVVLRLVAFLATISFVSCGSSSDGSSEEKGAGWTPVTTKKACDPKVVWSQEYNALVDVKHYADGDIAVTCKNDGGAEFGDYGEHSLKDNINNLTIVQLEKSIYEYSQSTTNNTISYISNYNYKTGIVHYKATKKGIDRECTETYPTILPKTIVNNHDNIVALLNWEGDENNMISTTCTAEDEAILEIGTIKSKLIKTNYTLTDNNDKKHLLYSEAKVNVQ